MLCRNIAKKYMICKSCQELVRKVREEMRGMDEGTLHIWQK